VIRNTDKSRRKNYKVDMDKAILIVDSSKEMPISEGRDLNFIDIMRTYESNKF
jgi:hypothetical protein